MQAKGKFLPLLLIGVISALIVAACTGSPTSSRDKTWYNLPSIPVRLNANGAASIWGLPVALDPATITGLVAQLQGMGVQRVELRTGFHGAFFLANGQELPYLQWDDAKMAELTRVLPLLGVGVDANTAGWLKSLRDVGIGLSLLVPPADGASALAMNRWTGEVLATPETPEVAVGPLRLGVSFNSQGTANIAGISADQLAAIAGVTIPSLDANTLALINSLGLANLFVTTQPNGIDVALDESPFPGLAYDSGRLAALQPLLAGFLGGQAAMADQVMGSLQATDLTLSVNFTGESTALDLGDIPVVLGADGSLNVMGVPAGNVVSPETITLLQDANIQTVAVQASSAGVNLAVNGQALPSLEFAPDALGMVIGALGPMGGGASGLVETLLGGDGMGTTVSIPPAEGVAPIDATAPVEAPALVPADLGGLSMPVIRANATFKDGVLTGVEGLPEQALAALGLNGVALPPAALDLLAGLNASSLTIKTEPNKLSVDVNGANLLSMGIDKNNLSALFNVAKPFLAGTPLENPSLSAFVENVLLPLLPGSDIVVTVNLE